MPPSKGVRKESTRPVEWRERRRGSRFNSSVTVALEWEDAAGKRQRCETKTRIVSSSGCLVVLPDELQLEQHLHVTNLVNQNSSAAAVVWVGKKRPEGWEYGIELVTADLDFWGLEI
jgi:hypothetical protein